MERPRFIWNREVGVLSCRFRNIHWKERVKARRKMDLKE